MESFAVFKASNAAMKVIRKPSSKQSTSVLTMVPPSIGEARVGVERPADMQAPDGAVSGKSMIVEGPSVSTMVPPSIGEARVGVERPADMQALDGAVSRKSLYGVQQS